MFMPLLLTCLLAAPPATRPATQSATQPADDVASLVVQLGATKWSDRRAAQAALAELGEAVRPQLEAGLDSDDAEVRARVRNLLAELDKVDPLEPARVTLKLDRASPAEAIAALEEAMDYQFMIEPEDWADRFAGNRVSVDLNDVTVLQAVHEIIPQCGLSIGDHFQGDLVAWGDSNWPDYPIIDAGAVQVEARSVALSHRRSVDFANGGKDTYTNGELELMLLIEPGFHVFGDPDVFIDEMTSNVGKNLSEPQEPRSYYNGEGSSIGQIISVPIALTLDANPPKLITELRGKFSLQVEKKGEDFVIDNPMEQGGERTFKNTRLVVEPVTKTDDGYTLKFHIENPGEISSQNSFLSTMQLTNADGKRLMQRGSNYTNRGSAIEGEFRFTTDHGEPTQFRWHVPLELDVLEVPFEFKDLPLP